MLRFSYETLTNHGLSENGLLKLLQSNDFNNSFCFAQEKERNYER